MRIFVKATSFTWRLGGILVPARRILRCFVTYCNDVCTRNMEFTSFILL